VQRAPKCFNPRSRAGAWIETFWRPLHGRTPPVPTGARRFLFNIVQYPGCGAFFPPACWLALERFTGRVCGVSLASLVRPEVGHITQICVSPSLRGQGLGYELLRRSLETLALSGAARVSLTVSAANESAVSFYNRLGFFVLHSFPALVWSGF